MRAMPVASAFQLPRGGKKQTLGGNKSEKATEGSARGEVLVSSLRPFQGRCVIELTAAIVPFTFEFPSRHRGNLHSFNGFNLPFNLHSEIDRPPFLFLLPTFRLKATPGTHHRLVF